MFPAISIWRKHVEFLIDRYTHYTTEGNKPEELGELFSTEWTRAAIAAVVSQGSGHITQVRKLTCVWYSQLIMYDRATPYGIYGGIGSWSFCKAYPMNRSTFFYSLFPCLPHKFLEGITFLLSATCFSIVSSSHIQVCVMLLRDDLTFLLTPIKDHDETFQAYSTFTTNYKPPSEYELLLVQASKLRSRAVKAFDIREPLETSLVRFFFPLSL